MIGTETTLDDTCALKLNLILLLKSFYCLMKTANKPALFNLEMKWTPDKRHIGYACT